MLEQLLFWDHKPGDRAVRLWMALALLSPLALVGSIYFQRSVLARMPARIGIDRTDAVASALKFLEARGVETANASVSVRSFKRLPIYHSLLTYQPEAIPRVPYWGFVKVTVREADGGEPMDVDLDLEGRVIGFRFQPPEMAPRRFTSAEARRLADEAKEARQKDWPHMEFGARDGVEPPQQSTAVPFRYTWPVRFTGVPHLEGTLIVRILSGEVVEDWIDCDLAPEGQVVVSLLPRWMSAVPFGIYVAAMMVFVVVRFVKRRVEKEVSTERMWVVAAVISLLFTIGQYLGDFGALTGNASTPMAWMAGAAFAGGVMGLVAGMFYSACEGDLRESFPNLLTSVDAALSGRLTSRNVGRSVVLGAALACWAFLVRNAVYFAFGPAFAGSESLYSALDFLFSKAPAVSAMLSTPAMALAVCLTALLCPLTLLAPRCANRKRLYVLLGLAAWFSVAMTSGEYLPFVPMALSSLALSLAVLWAFFSVDFLASMVVLVGWQLLGLAGLSRIAPVWMRHDQWAAGAGIAVIAAGVLCVWRGRVVDDDEVRPAYARNIEERMQLESEIAAAREAQQRLMPAAPPELPGISISAHCQPAEQVSGDFFDFFQISADRVALLVSDGGSNGLATALGIALTKGYLMHKAADGIGPVEALGGVAAMLGEELGFSAAGLCYGVIDQREQTVRYARMGATPALVCVGGSGRLEESVHASPGRRIHEGLIRLTPGQPLVVYTNGFSNLIGTRDSQGTHRWVLKRLRDITAGSAEVLGGLLKAANVSSGARGGRQDITLVVITASGSESRKVERVA